MSHSTDGSQRHDEIKLTSIKNWVLELEFLVILFRCYKYFNAYLLSVTPIAQ